MFESEINAVAWENDRLVLLDQRRLPGEETHVHCETSEAAAEAIRLMVVRGAPAIGIAAAYGAVLAAREAWREDPDHWQLAIQSRLANLAAARPTAVNLAWAIRRMEACCAGITSGDPAPVMLREARAIHEEDKFANRKMGEFGAELISPGSAVLTHCNAGALATGGYGTALGVIRAAWGQNRLTRVYAAETRPWLQGARLTAWELLRDRIPVTLITDGSAAYLMQQGRVQWVIVGADRITANGDVANKIGTLSHAIAARHCGVRFMVAAPVSTIDLATPDGARIEIEQRAGSEVTEFAGRPLAPKGCDAFNPVFDVTTAGLVDALVTERGVILRPDAEKIAKHCQ
jgi:methylthioribose-1-phosphate isomerase